MDLRAWQCGCDGVFWTNTARDSLMAVGKTPGIKKAVSEFRCGKRGAISKCEMRSGDGRNIQVLACDKKVSQGK